MRTVLAIAHNVTEFKRAELKAATQAPFSTQLATGRVQYVNCAVLPALGYDPGQLLAAHEQGEAPFSGWPSDEAALAWA